MSPRPEPLLAREGPASDEIRIIALELAVTPPDRREVELEMFPCRQTLPRGDYYRPHQVRVTLHTSHGDVTLTGELRQ